jgi:hypothetical protein
MAAKQAMSAIIKAQFSAKQPVTNEQHFTTQVKNLVQSCFAGYHGPFHSWFDDLYIFFSNENIQKKLGQLPIFQELKTKILVDTYPTPSKAAIIFQSFYSDQDLVKRFYQSKNVRDRAFLDLLIWEGCIEYKVAKEHFGETILEVVPERTSSLRCKRNYQQFAAYVVSMEYYDKQNTPLEKLILAKSVHFWMPPFMRYALSNVATKPKNHQLRPYQLPEGCSFYQAEASISQILPFVLQLITRQQIKCNKNGTLNIPNLKRLQTKSAIKSFPGDPGYAYIYILASFLNYNDGLYNAAVNLPQGSVQAIITYIHHIFLQQGRTPDMLCAILYPFEGLAKVRPQYLYQEAITEGFNTLKSLPDCNWISLDNFLDYGLYHHIDMVLMDDDLVEKQKLLEGVSYYQNYFQSNPLIRKKDMQRIFFTGILLTASTFGLIELAYDKALTTRYKKHASNLQDGLFTAFRLTALGRHILKGIPYNAQNDYVSLITTAENNGFELSENNLTIIVRGNTTLAAELLKPWVSQKKKEVKEQRQSTIGKTTKSKAKTDTPHIYKTNHLLQFDKERLLNQCDSAEALTNSIKDFIKIVGVNLPEFWKNELMSLIYRSRAIQPLNMAKVYQLSPLDNNLQQLIARDPILNPLCYKAANYMIIVPEPNSIAFKKRLATFGYLPDQSSNSSIEQINFQPEATNITERCQEYDQLFKIK